MALTWEDKIKLMAFVREPNEEDAPYRPAPIPNPGKPPWPGYPNPPKLAGGQELRDYLKSHTKGANTWDTGGGSLKHLSPDKILELTRGGLDRFKV
tara:strand:+ start:2301 stop:2588 length:288 start_codon:yes stop_codon:yes gene_type:complete